VKSGQYHHITDAELLRHYQSDKNPEWIGILLERYTLLLLGVCMKYLKDEEEAKDSVQQIFLKVLTDVSKYQVEYFKAWLYMVAKNHCLMRIRAQQGKEVREVHENTTAHLAEEKGADKENELFENEKTYDVLEEAIDELNDEQRRCIILFYVYKNSYQQISEKTGFTLLQVKSYIQNGKRNLKLLMEKKLKTT
jgi:RNA polymerase sigma factor (sigma-70 family)